MKWLKKKVIINSEEPKYYRYKYEFIAETKLGDFRSKVNNYLDKETNDWELHLLTTSQNTSAHYWEATIVLKQLRVEK